MSSFLFYFADSVTIKQQKKWMTKKALLSARKLMWFSMIKHSFEIVEIEWSNREHSSYQRKSFNKKGQSWNKKGKWIENPLRTTYIIIWKRYLRRRRTILSFQTD